MHKDSNSIPENSNACNSLVSVFNRVTDKTPARNITILQALCEIHNGTHSYSITPLRKLFEQGDKKEYSARKSKLPAFSPCGTFEISRKEGDLKSYSGIVILDIDNLPSGQVEAIKQRITKTPITYACFVSPSGNGLKIVVRANITIKEHRIAFNQLKELYEQLTGVQIDPSGKDLSRLCYFSYDKGIYINKESTIFTLFYKQESEKEGCVTFTNAANEYTSTFDRLVSYTENIIKFTKGSRNNFVHQLACNCNRAGIPQAIATQEIKARFNYDDREVTSTINSAYKNNDEFAKSAKFTNLQIEPSEDYLKNTPAIPENLYLQMPEILRKGAEVFNHERERDTFLTSALSILSGCLPGVKGEYDRQEIFPNLYSFVVAPAASGKGALKFAKMLAAEYHKEVLKTSNEEKNKYELQLAQYKMELRKSKGKEGSKESPIKPPFKIVFIPANTSCAKIILHLMQNDGAGIICETEADTMGNVFKQEWGGYSDMLRKAFHHEKISMSRKLNDEFLEVELPRLSVALSGTPGQVTGLIASSEDGLFSRFLYYVFKVEQVWKDVSPFGSPVNLTNHFNKLSIEVLEMVKFLEKGATCIDLADEQWQQLNLFCTQVLQDVTTFTAEEAASIVKRLGLIIFRISMLFTAMRKFENGEVADHLYCTDIDFNTALELVKIYLQHSLLMYNNLPKNSSISYFKGGDNKRQFFEALPDEFTRQEAIALAPQFNLVTRSADELLKTMLGKQLTQPKTGHYRKIK